MIVLGRIAAPFGIKGWLRIQPLGDNPLSWAGMSHWWLANDSEAPPGQWARHGLRDCQAHGKGLIVCLDGISDRNAAEALAGWFVAAPREALPRTGKDEYYWGDLVGMAVQNETGEPLGEVSGLLSTGAHEVLRVQDGESEHLIPFVAAYVLDVDLAARTIRAAWQKDW